MEAKTSIGAGNEGTGGGKSSPGRRKRRNGEDPQARFYLPKAGATLKNPELGEEVLTEGEALIRALKSDKPFYVLTVWRAVAQQNGRDPVITKQAITEKTE